MYLEKTVAKHLILSQRSIYNITFIYVQAHMKCWFAYFFTLKKTTHNIEVFGITFKKKFKIQRVSSSSTGHFSKKKKWKYVYVYTDDFFPHVCIKDYIFSARSDQGINEARTLSIDRTWVDKCSRPRNWVRNCLLYASFSRETESTEKSRLTKLLLNDQKRNEFIYVCLRMFV